MGFANPLDLAREVGHSFCNGTRLVMLPRILLLFLDIRDVIIAATAHEYVRTYVLPYVHKARRVVI